MGDDHMTRNRSSVGEEILTDGDYTVRTIHAPGKLAEAYRLRYRVFCMDLHWVKGGVDGLESDEYDTTSVSFGVYDPSDRLVAYIRLLTPYGRFMLEDVFKPSLGPEAVIRKVTDTAELSRFCLAKDTPKGTGGRDLALILFRGLHRWCLERDIRFLYAVTEERIFRLYRNRIPFRLMGEPLRMPDGVVARVAVLDWREYEKTGAVEGG